ncbi:DUF2637 domain-containing protein [Lentzea albidocapillata]|uniref:DUF2637 domain-containing protein n=1 Tax=Lentzea albidocapillata TaxID=40571 RepID=A0A1W2FQK6_9PSEU|nr:DUF2637 domain-containing protein [Lentzea albidocapillata]SMD24225.1 Protein of unknown function [Lentzea albidocapillata]
MTAVLDSGADLHERARQAYRDSRESGKPLSGQQLGEQFGRSRSWARDRIAEVRAAENVAEVAAAVVPVAATPEPEPVAEVVQTLAGGRAVAWIGFVFGSVMSVAANVLHTWLPLADMPAGWTPGVAPQIGAAVWPIGLLLSVEVLSRVPWPRGWAWSLARYGGAGTVALGSAVISYGHLRDVLLAWDYGPTGAHVGPLVLDGLMIISGFALLAMSSHDKTAKR